MADSFEGTKEYASILRDTSCLKVLYYLYQFNPNVPVDELSERLGFDRSTTVCCIEKLTKAKLVLREDGGGYSLTPFGRNAFKNLLGEDLAKKQDGNWEEKNLIIGKNSKRRVRLNKGILKFQGVIL